MDVRHPESFADFHLKGSLNIFFSTTFCHWAGWMLPAKDPIGLIIEKTHLYAEVVDQLRLIGFDQEIWVIQLTDNQKELINYSSFPLLDIEELVKQGSESLYILDVRTSEEWLAGHIPGSNHIELNELEKKWTQLPSHQPIALLCRKELL